MADLRIVDAPLLSTVKGTEKIPTGGEGNFSVSVNQVADFAKLKWVLATEGYVDNAVGNVQADLNLHKNSSSNPHQVTKVQVGLGNVDNTADLDKPVSNATQSAIITANSGKADKSYVDNALLSKSDKTYVDSQLALKSDKTYVDSTLLTKADKTYTDSQLALKADKSYVDSQDLSLQTQIDQKVEAEYVDNALTEQTNTVNTALSNISTVASKFYPTLAEANADIANLAVNQVVNIGEVANGGLWYKATAGAISLTKSPYDPLLQAMTDATTKATAAESNAKVYTNSKLDFISNIAENNQFIKELYITGWNGTNEIYLTEFNGNDGGKVTFRFKDKTASRDVIFTYQLAQGLQVYPLNTNGTATGSGFGGYIVIDWNAYLTSIFTGNTYTYKVSKKALSLANCPFIKQYIDNLATSTQVATNTTDISALKTVNAKSLTLASSATHAKVVDVNNFIKSVKIKAGYSSAFSYFVDSIIVTATTATINMKSFNSVDSSTAWISYNTTLTKSSDGVQTFEVKRDSYIILVTVDWKTKPSSNITGGTVVTLPLNASRLTEKDIIDLELAQPAFYKVRNDFKDGQSKLNHIFSAATFSASGDTAYTQAVTQVADGTRVVLANTNVNVNRRFRYNLYPFYVRMKDTYFMYVKYTINSVSMPSNTMLATLSRSGKTAASTNFFDNVVAGKTYEEVRKLTGDLTGETSNDGSLFIDFWSASDSPAGTVLDITIHDIRLVANYAQDAIFINKERKEVEQLVRALGYFEEEVVIPKFVDTALSTQNINHKLEMQSLGDSTSAMVMWQERLAQLKGWHFNRDLALIGRNGGYALALGGSWCEPIISNFGAIGAAGQNQYTRSTSISNYGVDVLFVLSSYNGQHPDKAWQSGGQLVKADHGINDAPYLGGEVNLITNPTADFPSFAASYYGMLEKIMTANPNTRIVLLTLYLFNVTGSDLNNILVKNAVIRKAAEKYSLQLIDLERISGINTFTAHELCFSGGVHINQKGGDRLAQVIGGIV